MCVELGGHPDPAGTCAHSINEVKTNTTTIDFVIHTSIEEVYS
ncbi:MAG TPA: hypothetical protein VG498_02200 [Terriglobales bacterium]|nr:hypothetical protein [Terriglobales bacterium]